MRNLEERDRSNSSKNYVWWERNLGRGTKVTIEWMREMWGGPRNYVGWEKFVRGPDIWERDKRIRITWDEREIYGEGQK